MTNEEGNIFLNETEEFIFKSYWENIEDKICKILKYTDKTGDSSIYLDILEDCCEMDNFSFFEKHFTFFKGLNNQGIVLFFDSLNKDISKKNEVNFLKDPFNTFYEGKVSKPGNFRRKTGLAKNLLIDECRAFLSLKRKPCTLYKDKNLSIEEKSLDKQGSNHLS